MRLPRTQVYSSQKEAARELSSASSVERYGIPLGSDDHSALPKKVSPGWAMSVGSAAHSDHAQQLSAARQRSERCADATGLRGTAYVDGPGNHRRTNSAYIAVQKDSPDTLLQREWVKVVRRQVVVT